MKFTKTIEQFDYTKFNVGCWYYIHWHSVDGKSIKAICKCVDIDEEENQLLMWNIIHLQGDILDSHRLRFGVEDTDNIVEVQEVEFETEYDVHNGRWSITMEVVDGTDVVKIL